MDLPRTPLSDALPIGSGDDIFDRFDAAVAADDFNPLPRGTYVALAVGGKLEKARTGTVCYTIEFRVLEGEYAGRRLWMTKYFTPDALPYTKRDLSKLGLGSTEKLRQPFGANRLVCKLGVVVRKLDDGSERNEVRSIEVIEGREPEVDPFAPKDQPEVETPPAPPAAEPPNAASPAPGEVRG